MVVLVSTTNVALGHVVRFHCQLSSSSPLSIFSLAVDLFHIYRSFLLWTTITRVSLNPDFQYLLNAVRTFATEDIGDVPRPNGAVVGVFNPLSGNSLNKLLGPYHLFRLICSSCRFWLGLP